MTRCLGLDVSLTSSGYALFDYSAGLGGHGVLKTSASEPMRERLVSIRSRVFTLCSVLQPDFVVMESGFSGGMGPSATKLGMAQGAVYCGLPETCPEPMLIAPKTLKKFATGSGNSDKDAVVTTARGIGYRGDHNDIADAVWLAAMGIDIYHMVMVHGGIDLEAESWEGQQAYLAATIEDKGITADSFKRYQGVR